MVDHDDAVDYEYRKILVIGAKKTGKTSILSTAGQFAQPSMISDRRRTLDSVRSADTRCDGLQLLLMISDLLSF